MSNAELQQPQDRDEEDRFDTVSRPAAVYPSPREVQVAFVGLALGMFLPAASGTMVSTALPAILRDLGGLDRLSFVVSSYLLASAVALPVLGKLSDLYGRRLLFELSLGVFAIGSLWAATAGSIDSLVVARALQGFGGGGLITLAQAAVADLVPPRRRGAYLGVTVTILGLASVVGPLLGGVIVDRWSWRIAFGVNVPLGLVAIVIAHRYLPPGVPRRRPPIDVVGALLLVGLITAFVLIVDVGAGPAPLHSPLLVAGVPAVVLGLVALFAVERRVAEPVLPPELFRHRAFSVTLVVGFLVSGGMYAVLVFVPLYIQGVRGRSAGDAGLVLLPLMASWMATTTVAGRLISRWDHFRSFPIAGTALLTAGFLLLGRMGQETGSGAVAVYMVVVGVAFGLTLQILVVAVQNSVPPQHLGAATSAVQLTRTIGGTVGVAIGAAVVNTRLAARLADVPGMNAGRLVGDLDAVSTLGTAPQALFRAGLADGITFTFLLLVPLAALAWGATLLLPADSPADL